MNDPLQGFTSGALRVLPRRHERPLPTRREGDTVAEATAEFAAHLETAEGEAELFARTIQHAVGMSEKGSPQYERDQRRLRQTRIEERARLAERAREERERALDAHREWLASEAGEAAQERNRRAALDAWLAAQDDDVDDDEFADDDDPFGGPVWP
ncbi:MAG TPA: hypothetical protein VFA43_26610 [Gemmatimonadaceae bacterium]|nr:hypothetical protein [Gemmatimonadaceae bacterium]